MYPVHQLGLSHNVKLKDATYKKVMLLKGTFESVDQRPFTISETIDAVFLATCTDMAKANKLKLPADFFLKDE